MVEYDFVKVPIVDIVNQIILYASQHRASDIHFDPLEDALMVRMRIDGDLQNHSLVPKVYERNLITRIKLVSSMNITETRLPQDGAIRGRIGGKDLDMRVSILPTNEGEKCVIRILDFQKGLSGLDGLGFTPKNFEKIQKMLAVPFGIILVTGATGSGKSTTTYSMLQALNKEETNVITVEDPIEMNIEGINQVQINSEIGMTFAAALRSILRQDPNVILIGEMRDEETAQIAVRASITGHLVLSTIHTNSALATIERLIDMGIERYMLATSVTGIISQKLSRTLCNKCKKKRPVTKYERHMFARVLNQKVKEVYEPVGCEDCHQGFTGRIALHEVLYISEHLRDLIADESLDKEELRKAVYGTGETTTLLQDALQKVVDGHTTFQEIYRVVDIDVDLDNSIKSEIGDGDDDDDDDDTTDWNGYDEDKVEQSKEEDKPKKHTNKKVNSKKEKLKSESDEEDDELVEEKEEVEDTKDIEDEFIKDLSPSDPEFIKFLIQEDEVIIEEDKKDKKEKELLFEEFLKEYDEKFSEERKNRLFIDFLKEYDEKLSKEMNDKLFKVFLNNYDQKLYAERCNMYEELLQEKTNPILEDIIKCTSIDDEEIEEEEDFEEEENEEDLQVVLKENNTLDNVIGGYMTDTPDVTNNVLDLSNVEFNYKEVLEIIDAYANVGPEIQDVVDNDIKVEQNTIDISSDWMPSIRDIVETDVRNSQDNEYDENE